VLATNEIENVDGIKSVMNNLNVVGGSHPIMKRLSKVEAADDPADGATEDEGAVQRGPEIVSPTKGPR
jgi:hypothetical protein